MWYLIQKPVSDALLAKRLHGRLSVQFSLIACVMTGPRIFGMLLQIARLLQSYIFLYPGALGPDRLHCCWTLYLRCGWGADPVNKSTMRNVLMLSAMIFLQRWSFLRGSGRLFGWPWHPPSWSWRGGLAVEKPMLLPQLSSCGAQCTKIWSSLRPLVCLCLPSLFLLYKAIMATSSDPTKQIQRNCMTFTARSYWHATIVRSRNSCWRGMQASLACLLFYPTEDTSTGLQWHCHGHREEHVLLLCLLTSPNTRGDNRPTINAGKASQKLQEMVELEASSTVHRLLQYKAAGSRSDRDDEEALEGSYTFCRGNPLQADAVLVDEASMLDITLAAALLEALGPKTQLVLVGKLFALQDSASWYLQGWVIYCCDLQYSYNTPA